MRVDGKLVCDAYGCKKTASYIRIIADQKYSFCCRHRDCLDHGRAETILVNISERRRTIDDLLSMYNFNETGFSKEVLLNTVMMLHESKYLDITDDIISIQSSPGTCKFPGCNNKKVSKHYCVWHDSMPNISMVNKCLSLIMRPGKTYKDIASSMKIDHDEAKRILRRLESSGVIVKIKSGYIPSSEVFYE